jgi:hypothetical protein
MIVKQYSIKLRADYDMQIIRRRVADKGAAYDTFPGLHLSSWMLVGDRAALGRPLEYARMIPLPLGSVEHMRVVAQPDGSV